MVYHLLTDQDLDQSKKKSEKKLQSYLIRSSKNAAMTNILSTTEELNQKEHTRHIGEGRKGY